MSHIPFNQAFLQSQLATLTELNRLSVQIENKTTNGASEHLIKALDSIYASYGQLVDTLLQHEKDRIYTSDPETYIIEQLNYSASQLNRYIDQIKTPE